MVFNSEKIRYFSLGRHALLAAFKILKICKNDKILLPSFICKELLACINSIGAIPIYYDVGQDLTPINLPDDQEVKVVLAVNYFGFPQDLSIFYTYCAQKGIAIIEDNAHGFLSCNEAGVLLGTRADLGICCIHKTIMLPNGAILIVNKPSLQNEAPSQLPFCKKTLPMFFYLKKWLAWGQYKTGLKFFLLGMIAIRQFRYLTTGFKIDPIPVDAEFKVPGNQEPHHYLINALSKLDYIKEVNRRRELYFLFENEFSTLRVKPVFNSLPLGVAPYGYPFYSDEVTILKAISIAQNKGFDCISWPDLPSQISSTSPQHYRSLWVVNFK